MKISQLLSVLDSIAPFEIAQSWDNVGLLIGDENADAGKIIFAVDVTTAVVDEAIAAGCNTIIGYHPVIWEPLKRITACGQKPIVYRLLKEGINVISIHTALDAAAGGVNDSLAAAIGLIDTEPLGDYVSLASEEMCKLIVFVPVDSINAVSKAVFDAGAGRLGNYSDCGFSVAGEGTFLPLEGSKPAVGRKGCLEKATEIKFETLVCRDNLAAVLEAMKKAHPYEVPAYDVMKLETFEKRFGIGRAGRLERKKTIDEVVADIKELTGAKALGFIGKPKGYITSAAVCAGSCGSIIAKVIAAGCQLYITGELKHHDAILARESGLVCICLSHSVSERFVLAELAEKIKAQCAGAELLLSKNDTDPFSWQEV